MPPVLDTGPTSLVIVMKVLNTYPWGKLLAWLMITIEPASPGKMMFQDQPRCWFSNNCWPGAPATMVRSTMQHAYEPLEFARRGASSTSMPTLRIFIVPLPVRVNVVLPTRSATAARPALLRKFFLPPTTWAWSACRTTSQPQLPMLKRACSYNPRPKKSKRSP